MIKHNFFNADESRMNTNDSWDSGKEEKSQWLIVVILQVLDSVEEMEVVMVDFGQQWIRSSSD